MLNGATVGIEMLLCEDCTDSNSCAALPFSVDLVEKAGSLRVGSFSRFWLPGNYCGGQISVASPAADQTGIIDHSASKRRYTKVPVALAVQVFVPIRWRACHQSEAEAAHDRRHDSDPTDFIRVGQSGHDDDFRHLKPEMTEFRLYKFDRTGSVGTHGETQ